MRKEYPVDKWFRKNVLVRHRILMTLIVFWIAGLVFYGAPEYGRLFEMSVIMLWVVFIVPVIIGRVVWNYNHNPEYLDHHCDRCGSKNCCVKEVDDEEEPQE